MEFPVPVPPSMPKVEAHISNESSMSDYCRFVQVVLSLLLMEGLDADFDLGVEQVNSSSSDRLRVRFVLCVDNALCRHIMKTKDLQPEILQWYLQLKKFDYVVHDNAKVHILTNLEQA